MKIDPNRYRLLNSFSGKVIATADRPEKFRQVITVDQAGAHTIHDRLEGWFSPAGMIFPRVRETKPEEMI